MFVVRYSCHFQVCAALLACKSGDYYTKECCHQVGLISNRLLHIKSVTLVLIWVFETLKTLTRVLKHLKVFHVLIFREGQDVCKRFSKELLYTFML